MKIILSLFTLFYTLTTLPAKAAETTPAAPLAADQFDYTITRTIPTKYLLYLPKDFAAASGKRWPLMLFLHGAGERGDDLALVAKHGPLKFAQQGTNFPFIIVAPQCPKGQHWDNDVLMALLDRVLKQHPVDESRIYLTGLSMGGFGTWSLGAAHPEKFAAIAPVCGGGNFIEIHLAPRPALKSLGVWAFHGVQDPVVPVAESERMIAQLKKIGCDDAQLTLYPEAKHDAWTETYTNPKFYEWLLAHHR